MLAITDQKKVCWDQFCVTRTGGMLAKCADIWLFGQHVADMSVTFLAKRGNAQQLGQVQCLCRRHVSPCQESWHRQWQDFYHTTTVGHLCAERMRCCCYFCCFRQTNAQEHHLDSVSSLLRCKTHKNRWRSRWGQ